MEADALGFLPPRGCPVATRRPVVREVHGLQRIDDYAWLRDPADPATRAYLDAERDHYATATADLRPLRDRLEAELAARVPAEDASVTWQRRGLVYFWRSRRDDVHERLHRFDPRSGAELLVLDPNTVPGYVPGSVDPSPDGAVVAYAVAAPSGPGGELRFRDVATGLDLSDRLPGVAAGGAWSASGREYLYAGLDARGRAAQVRWHRVGAPVDADTPVVTEAEPDWVLAVTRCRDARWIAVTASTPGSTEVHLVDARDPARPPACVAGRRPGVEYAVESLPGGWDGSGDDLLLVVTDDGAPEFRLMQAWPPPPGGRGRASDWRPVEGLPGRGERLEGAAVLDRHVVLTARRDAETFLRVIDRPPRGSDLPARPVTRELHPGVPYGQLRLWHPDDPATSTLVFVEENLVTAPAWVAVDLASGARSVVKRTSVPDADPTAYTTERLWVTSADGVRVPVTIAHRRDARRGRTTGLLLTGHGAHERCSWPHFDVTTLSLLDRGMVVAVAHVRGGGELGRSWWHAARGASKPRSVVDLVTVRDALVAAGWAGEVRGGARVVARGRGAGALLAGTAFSRAPRMWRAVVAEEPAADLVTALSDPDLPSGAVDRAEWGDPAGSAEDLAALLSWSPYDNPPPPGRPALLVTAASPRAGSPGAAPAGAAAWVARLRATDDARSPSPLLLRIASDGDRPDGRPAPPQARAGRRYEAEILAWVLHHLDLD